MYIQTSEITQHCLERFCERGKRTNIPKAIESIFKMADGAISIGKHRFYKEGWIFVVVKGTIKTTYKIKKTEEYSAVFKSFQNKSSFVTLKTKLN